MKARVKLWGALAILFPALFIQISDFFFHFDRATVLLTSLPLVGISFGMLLSVCISHSRNLKKTLTQVQTDVKKFLFHSEKDTQTDVLTELEDHLKFSIDYIKSIGEGKFDASYPGMTDKARDLNKTSLSGELLVMKEKMRQISEEEKQRNWATAGVAYFTELVHANLEMEELLNKFISELVKYIGANQAGIFIVNDTQADDIFLELKGCYAYERQRYVQRRQGLDEGLVGQVFLEKEPIYIADVPADYLSITSGLGEAPPKYIFIIPIKNQDRVEGVIEMASFKEWKEYEKEFVIRIGEVLGSAVNTMKISEHTQKLLTESQEHSKLLETQEEELRQNLEELSATQEALQRQSEEATEFSSKFKAIIDSTVDAIITISEEGIIESVNKACLSLFGYTEKEMLGKNVSIIVPDPHHQHHDQYLINYKNTGEAKVMGKVRHLEAIKKGGQIIPVELAVNVADLGNRKIYTGIVRDISDRVEAERKQQEYIEELRAQEEELRQNTEELQATQEEIHRQMLETKKINGELDARIAALNVSTIVSESDLKGRITFVNDKFCEISEYSREELMGKPHNIVRHPDMPREVFRLLWQNIKSGQVFRGIIKNKKKYGGHYWVDAVISPVLNDEEKPIKYIGVRYVIEDDETGERLYSEQLERLGISPEPV